MSVLVSAASLLCLCVLLRMTLDAISNQSSFLQARKGLRLESRHCTALQFLTLRPFVAFPDVDQEMSLGAGAGTVTVREYLYQSFGYKHDFIGWVALILVGTSQASTEGLSNNLLAGGSFAACEGFCDPERNKIESMKVKLHASILRAGELSLELCMPHSVKAEMLAKAVEA